MREADIGQRRYVIEFGQIYLSKPTQVEQDGTTSALFPQEARVRNLTYATPLYVDIASQLLLAGDVDDPIEADWRPALTDDGMPIEEKDQALIGKVCRSQLHFTQRYARGGPGRRSSARPGSQAVLSAQKYRPAPHAVLLTFPDPRHDPIKVLSLARHRRAKLLQHRRVPIRLWRLLYCEGLREGPHRPRTHGL